MITIKEILETIKKQRRDFGRIVELQPKFDAIRFANQFIADSWSGRRIVECVFAIA